MARERQEEEEGAGSDAVAARAEAFAARVVCPGCTHAALLAPYEEAKEIYSCRSVEVFWFRS